MPAELSSSALRPDGKRVPIHPLDVEGRFITARRAVFALLIALYLAAPLVPIGGHPAVHLDIETRRFYLFGGTFNAQDVWILLFMATTLAFGLLFVTAWRGRLWCGWACPQTVFLEAVYRPIERLIDGPRTRRIKQAQSGWPPARVGRTVLRHAAYLLVSAVIAHAMLALFVSTADLLAMVTQGPAAHPGVFLWAVALTAALYVNFAWFREQFCIVLCPYGRLQSILHDDDSTVIGYDAHRGEPRGPMKRSAGLPVVSGTGHCIDCKKCVWACPTGIDIRNGFQMECVACAQCIDVCDEVMDKIGRPRGLIRYASLNELAGRKGRILRPRLVLYGALTALCFALAVAALVGRTPFESNIVRAPGVPWVLEGDTVRNQVYVHLVNKHGEPARFRLAVTSPVPAKVSLGQEDVELASLADTRIPLVVTIDRAHLRAPVALDVRVHDVTSGTSRIQPLRFVAPASVAP